MSVFAEFTMPVTAFPPGGRLTTHAGITVELERIVPTGSVTHYFWIVGEEYERALNALRTDSAITSLDTLDELADRVLVRAHWRDLESPVFELIEANEAVIVEATGTGEEWTVTLRFPDRDAFAAFYEDCRARGVTLELQGVEGSGFGHDEDRYGLTASQREAVTAAFEAGYFDVPRATTLAKLADQLGISEQALSERIRRGLARYLTATIHDQEWSDAGTDD